MHEKTSWLQVRLTPGLKARLEKAAGSRKMSDFAREAIEEKIARHDGEGK